MNMKDLDKYVVIQIAIFVGILIFTPFSHLGILTLPSIGIVLLLAALVIVGISWMQLGTAFTPAITPIENAPLVTTGIYSIVRHPMYLGVILLAFGWSFFWGSLLSFIFSIILAIFFDFKSAQEEILLTQKFPAYAEYKTRVQQKLIPFLY